LMWSMGSITTPRRMLLIWPEIMLGSLAYVRTS
jgi:hypothetical protein